MIRGSAILGSIGILPLTDECFEELKELRKRERNIRAHDIFLWIKLMLVEHGMYQEQC